MRILLWNCGGSFMQKVPALLDSCGDAEVVVVTEPHLPGDAAPPVVPGYSVWVLSRMGALRPSGGVLVLVHDSVAAWVQPWQQPTTSQYHMWLRIEAGIGLERPLYLAAGYLPPTSSKYGLRSAHAMEDYFAGLGDEVAAAAAEPGGADIVLAGDWNAHIGLESEQADYSSLFEAALGDAADDVLMPCAGATPLLFPPRASCCGAAVCKQGRGLLSMCKATGLLIGNGRLPGDELGSPTCFSSSTPSVIDLLIGSPGLLMQASQLRVLPPIPEYLVHRPLELVVHLGTTGSAAQAAEAGTPRQTSQHDSQQQQSATPATAGSRDTGVRPPGQLRASGGRAHAAVAAETAAAATGFGPPPTLQPALRITEQLMPAWAERLGQPETVRQLEAAAARSADDVQAASELLCASLYEAAAEVFPAAADSQQRNAQRATHRRRHQPWFDQECKLARERLRMQLCAAGSHLSRECAKALSSKYTLLRKRKAAVWRRQRSAALLQLHRLNPRKFFKRWKQKQAGNPISAAAWLKHFVGLQRQRAFKPTRRQRTAAGGEAAGHDSAASPPPSQPAASSQLDDEWTPEEVHRSLSKLSASSSCLGPLKAALLKAGAAVLAPVLATLFNNVFVSGRVPREWLLGAITAIYKGKGDASNPNSYRGITVGHVLGKLYALMLNDRLTTWAEGSGVRARGQAGFRQGFCTIDNCFVLRAVVERARAQGTKLYVCAVDLEKAFDSVDRPLLWASLQRAGVGGYMLAAIQSLYADVPVCVKTAEGLSQTFQSVLGVKQGCPLSPLLFGIFLDDFEQHVARTAGAAAQLPLLCGRRVPPLLFADDMLLLASTPAGLNAQLAALQSYCDAKKLTVNAAKTQVMIMRPGGGGGNGQLAAGETFTYAGEQLEVVKTSKYLGLTFAQLSKTHGFSCCAEELAAAGRRALMAMRRRARELGAGAVEHQLQLFDIFVKPVLSYGCEVWGVDVLGRPDAAPERVHRWFCRRLLGLPQSATSAVVLAELGRWPLHVQWAQQTCRFWNRLLGMGEEGQQRLVYWAFQDNLALMQSGADLAVRSPCWCRKWFTHLQSAPTDSGTLVWLTQLQEEAVVERTKAALVRAAAAPREGAGAVTTETTAAGASPRSIYSQPANQQPPASAAAGSRETGVRHPVNMASGGRAHTTSESTGKFARYLDCVRGDLPLGQLAPHLRIGAVRDARHCASLTRFRCSCHDLRVERDRYLPAPLKPPRHLRTCLICAGSAVEDEQHMVFDCPLYAHIRFEFADLFSTSTDLSSFLLQTPDRVAQFIHACSTARHAITCT